MKPEAQGDGQERWISTPLTHHFGLYRFKSELEDLAFKYINPDEYQKIVNHLLKSKEDRERYVKSVVGPLRSRWHSKTSTAPSRAHQEYLQHLLQMQNRSCGLDDIFDIFAIRIIVETIPECYLALGYVCTTSGLPLQGLSRITSQRRSRTFTRAFTQRSSARTTKWSRCRSAPRTWT